MREFVYDSWNSVMNAEINSKIFHPTNKAYGATSTCLDVVYCF